MNSSILGPHAWYFIHVFHLINTTNTTGIIIFSLVKLAYYQGVLARSIWQKLQKLNICEHLNSRELLIEFVIKLHNLVNKDLNKPIFSKEQAIELYTDLYSSKKKHGGEYNTILLNNSTIYIILIIIIGLIYYYIKMRK